ncbi:MAG: hypothetical protein L0G87_05495 [Renibacterium salmoninarum]|nr:hypothetical protein [Renibacterium salmoninarum]
MKKTTSKLTILSILTLSLFIAAPSPAFANPTPYDQFTSSTVNWVSSPGSPVVEQLQRSLAANPRYANRQISYRDSTVTDYRGQQVDAVNERLVRWDRRDPNTIFEQGFVPIAPDCWDDCNSDIGGYVDDGRDSLFVSTTRYQNRSGRPYVWTPRNVRSTYMYEIFAPGGIDVNQTLGDHSHANQQEVAFAGGIRPQYIRLARQYDQNGNLVRIIANGGFDPYPYSSNASIVNLRGQLPEPTCGTRTEWVAWVGQSFTEKGTRAASDPHDDVMRSEGDVQEDVSQECKHVGTIKGVIQDQSKEGPWRYVTVMSGVQATEIEVKKELAPEVTHPVPAQNLVPALKALNWDYFDSAVTNPYQPDKIVVTKGDSYTSIKASDKSLVGPPAKIKDSTDGFLKAMQDTIDAGNHESLTASYIPRENHDQVFHISGKAVGIYSTVGTPFKLENTDTWYKLKGIKGKNVDAEIRGIVKSDYRQNTIDVYKGTTIFTLDWNDGNLLSQREIEVDKDLQFRHFGNINGVTERAPRTPPSADFRFVGDGRMTCVVSDEENPLKSRQSCPTQRLQDMPAFNSHDPKSFRVSTMVDSINFEQGKDIYDVVMDDQVRTVNGQTGNLVSMVPLADYPLNSELKWKNFDAVFRSDDLAGLYYVINYDEIAMVNSKGQIFLKPIHLSNWKFLDNADIKTIDAMFKEPGVDKEFTLFSGDKVYLTKYTSAGDPPASIHDIFGLNISAWRTPFGVIDRV